MNDKLEDMLKRQEAFQKKYNFKQPIHMWIAALNSECGELWSKCNGKWWKRKQNTRDERLEELADIMHFIFGFMLEEGISAEELYQAYCKKLKINYERQESSY